MDQPLLRIEAPDSYRAERQYVARVLFEEFLGLRCTLEFSDRHDVIVQLPAAGTEPARCLRLPDLLFQTPSAAWLTASSLPHRPVTRFRLEAPWSEPQPGAPELVVLYAPEPAPAVWVSQSAEEIRIGFDLLGSAFFMLSGYEELVSEARDKHGRFAASSARSVQEGFVGWPVVDQYVELLWTCLSRLWPALRRRERQFRVQPSHDVDQPFRFGLFSAPRMLRELAAGLVVAKRTPRELLGQAKSYLGVRRGDPTSDPAYRFEEIMDWSEALGLQSELYFIACRRSPLMDGTYELDHPYIRRLLRRVHERGHRIGLHTSYTSDSDPQLVRAELVRLQQICAEEGVQQASWGNRQHYLRWNPRTTAACLDAAGFTYDTSLGYADHAGFRRGTCHEFPIFDLLERKQLTLREKPLVLMECTVIDPVYMGMGRGPEARKHMQALREACRRYRGTFTCLWHNHRFAVEEERGMYRELVAAR